MSDGDYRTADEGGGGGGSGSDGAEMRQLRWISTSGEGGGGTRSTITSGYTRSESREQTTSSASQHFESSTSDQSSHIFRTDGPKFDKYRWSGGGGGDGGRFVEDAGASQEGSGQTLGQSRMGGDFVDDSDFAAQLSDQYRAVMAAHAAQSDRDRQG